MAAIGYWFAATAGIAFVLLAALDYLGVSDSRAGAGSNLLIGVLMLAACGYELTRGF